MVRKFFDFFAIFFPALVSYLIPAVIMQLAIPNICPEKVTESTRMKKGAITAILLFLTTIIITILFHNLLHLPPVMGMMTGLGLLNFYAYYLKTYENKQNQHIQTQKKFHAFDIFNKIKHAEWDTLFFFLRCDSVCGRIGNLRISKNHI